MEHRLPASERTRGALHDLIAGRLSSDFGRTELIKLATRLIVENGLEGEVRDALERDYYESGGGLGGGYRNGVRKGTSRRRRVSLIIRHPRYPAAMSPSALSCAPI